MRRSISSSTGFASRALIDSLEPRTLFATVASGFVNSQFVTGLSSPTQMAWTPDGRLLVCEQGGKLRLVKNGALQSSPVISLTVNKAGERGLSGVVADPDFETNHYIYVYYTRYQGSVAHNRLSRLTMAGDAAAASTEKVLLDLDPLTSYAHMGGGLHFGDDGKLYVSVGENARGSPAQKLDTLLGKILRLNKDGTIPSDNPFYDRTTGNNRAIYSMGLRNPFTFAIQPGTQTLFINDVGESTYEEVNKGGGGKNFGWPNSEGPTTNPAFTTPVYYYDHSDGGHAVIGADFYPTSGTFPSQYRGKYIFGDHNKGWIKVMDPSSTAIIGSIVTKGIEALTDIDIGPDGALYYIERTYEGVGKIGRVQSTSSQSSSPQIVQQPQSQTVDFDAPATFTVVATGASLKYQWQRNGSNITGATAASYRINSADGNDNGDQFRAIVSNTSGSITSDVATLTVRAANSSPVATINSPSATLKYKAGDTINFSGSAIDPQDGALGGTSLAWAIVFHHDTHTHPFLDGISGSSGSFTLPTDGETSANTWYRINLIATDSGGNSTTTYREIFPQKSTLTATANFSGLKVMVDAQPKDTPYTFDSVVNFPHTFSVMPTQIINGQTYQFTGWSDGVTDPVRVVVTPTGNATFTAQFSGPDIPAGATLAPSADSYVRGGTSAAANFGASPEIDVKFDSNTANRREGLLKFDLSSVATINSATLRLFGRQSSTGAPVVFDIFGSSNTTWTETGVNYNNRPASSTAALASGSVASKIGQWFELDLTTYLQQQKAAGKQFVTLILRGKASSVPYLIIASNNAAENRPELKIG